MKYKKTEIFCIVCRMKTKKHAHLQAILNIIISSATFTYTITTTKKNQFCVDVIILPFCT